MTKVELGRDPDEDRRVALASEQIALDAALAQVEAHANDDWLSFAKYVMVGVARSNPSFIVDAIWDAGLGKPPEARAIGTVLRWAASERLIEATTDFIPSAQPGSHKVPRRVWRSLIYRDAA